MISWGTFLWLVLILIGVGFILDSYMQWARPAEQPGSVGASRLLPPLITNSLQKLPSEQASPSDGIHLNQIQVNDASVTINGIANPILAQLTNTNSMDPTFDSEATLLETPVTDVNDIQAGDIVSYITPLNEGIIVHRVVEVGHDESGWYARLKGDNLNSADPQLVRASQIQRKVLAIFY